MTMKKKISLISAIAMPIIAVLLLFILAGNAEGSSSSSRGGDEEEVTEQNDSDDSDSDSEGHHKHHKKHKKHKKHHHDSDSDEKSESESSEEDDSLNALARYAKAYEALFPSDKKEDKASEMSDDSEASMSQDDSLDDEVMVDHAGSAQEALEKSVSGTFQGHGTIGNNIISMTLQTNQMLDGSYYYDKYGPSNQLTIQGNYHNDGYLRIDEQNAAGEVTGTFTGRVNGNTYSGEWTSVNGSKSFHFNITFEFEEER